MKRAALLLLTLALTPSRAAETEASLRGAASGFKTGFSERHSGGGYEGVDLSAQFSDGARDQGSVGDCHDFATVALLETAWKRQTGTAVELSPADLFIQGTALAGRYDYGMMQHYFAPYVAGGSSDLSAGEGGSVAEDVAFALSHGVAYETTLPYPQLYQLYTEGIRPFIQSQMAQADADADKTNKANRIDPGMKVVIGNQVWTVAQLRREEAVQLSVVDAVNAFIKALLAERAPALEKDRARTRSVLSGFSPIAARFPTTVPKSYLEKYMADAGLYGQKPGDRVDAHDLSGKDCWAAGTLQRRFLLEQLDAGRPVAVGYDLRDGGPGAKPAPRSGHAVVVYAYGLERNHGELVFTARNSWGAKSPRLVIPAHKLCRVHEAVALKVPADPR
jgi:hypothetical protein